MPHRTLVGRRPIYLFGHQANNASASYYEISTDGQSLQLSGQHFLPVCKSACDKGEGSGCGQARPRVLAHALCPPSAVPSPPHPPARLRCRGELGADDGC